MKMCKNGGIQMTLRKFISQHKKKVSALSAILLATIVAIIAISYLNADTKADVFKKDSEGNMQTKSEINILEIVAEYGQQVIGFTVSGYEPIKKEQIENYHGDIDIEDFRTATGYEIEKTGSGDGNCSYTVLRNALENTFNQNVLGDSMEEGKIIVTTCQANEVTTDMINNADLIYINSNNYNKNSMYYYDQMTQDGKMGIAPGESGSDYDDFKEVQVIKTEAALKKIQEAAGRKILASSLTENDFLLAGIENFKIYNLDAYNIAISELEKGALTASTNEDSIVAIDAIVQNSNVTEKTNAIKFIRNNAGKLDITETGKAELIQAFLKAELANCIEANYNNYIDAIINNAVGYSGFNAIQTMITTQNTAQMREAIEKLIEFKNSIEPIEDLSIIENVIAKIAYGNLNTDLLTDYVTVFMSDTFRFSNESKLSACNSDLATLIDNVNNTKKQEALALIADAPANADSMIKLQGNPTLYFELAKIEGYNKCNIEEYIKALSELEDVNSLKPEDEIESQSETEAKEEDADETKESTDQEDKYIYDYNAIVSFIADVNAREIHSYVNQTFDISWENALALYQYAIVDEGGLMYDTEILTFGNIGDFTKDLETNNNNLYKILLIMRQLQPDYCMTNILPNIDENGVYYPDGGLSGTGISAWHKYTFYSEGSGDYNSYREPNVIGQTYSTTGVKGNVKNYVYKHIYSYTGEQFLGGALFVGESLESFLKEGGVITPGTGDNDKSNSGISTDDVDETENFMLFDTGSSGLRWTTAYAYFWGSGMSEAVNVKMTTHDATRRQFRVQIPKGAEQVIFKSNEGWTNQTQDVTISSTVNSYYLTNSKTNNTYRVTTTVPYGYTMYYGNLTNSKNSGEVGYNDYIDLTFRAYNITKAYYQIDGGEVKQIGPNDTIRIGNGIAPGTRTKIYLWYDTSTGKGERNYTYLKQDYTYSVTNVIRNAEVKYYNSADIKVEASGLTNLRYKLDSGSEKTLNSGDVIKIGDGISEGIQTCLTVSYNYSGKSYTRKYYLLKVSKDEVNLDNLENNYLSKKTADNISSLSSDTLQEDYVNDILINGNKGDVIRYIMGITLNQLQEFPFNVLEIQPTAAVSILNTYEGALKIADYLRIDLPSDMTKDNYKEYINIVPMSVKEFNTRNEDLTGEYDLIYFGIESGYQVVNPYNVDDGTLYRTYYNDKTMNGLVYTGIGDSYGIQAFLTGSAREDYQTTSSSFSGDHRTEYNYWANYFTEQFTGNKNNAWNLNPNASNWILKNSSSTTRLTGNDITVKKMNELLEYVKAGYPILLPDEIFNCDSDLYIDYDNKNENADSWRYVDVNSKIYNFITSIKTLGYNNNTGEFDGLDSEGNKIFSDGKTYANIVQETYAKYGKNPDNLSAANKFNGGLSFAVKRNFQVSFTLIDCPQEYNKDAKGNELDTNGIDGSGLGNTIKSTSSDFSSYRFELQVNSDVSMEWLHENYSYQIYVDKAGTGRFDKEYTIELDPRYDYIESEKKVIIEGKWPGNMDGFMPWKIVAYNKTNPENHYSYSGFSAFEIPASDRKTVYILWVKTQASSNGGSNLAFDNMISTLQSSISEYELKLVTISYSDFVRVWSSTSTSSPETYTSDNTKIKVGTMLSQGGSTLRGVTIDNEERAAEFNMLVFGFCDSYRGLDINNMSALNNIQYFVDSGHSMLFAHDNVSYLSTMNYYVNSGTSTPTGLDTNWGRYSTSYLRDILGMDVYGASYSGYCFDESSDRYLEYLSNTRKYLRDDLTQKDYRGIIETCVYKYTADGYGNRLYSLDMNSSTPHSIKDWQRTKTVQRINRGQISEYPFIIGEILDTASTHTQYMNLNMEDDDITVWYTLSCNKNATYNQENSKYYLYTEGDGSNNYYIYSRGNVTYTGSGHSVVNGKNEQRLFLNTIVAAIKAGNFAPEVIFPDAENNAQGENIVYRYVGTDDGVTISFKPIDYDAAKDSHAFTDCKIYIDVNENGIYDKDIDIILSDSTGHTNLVNVASGAPINFIGTDLENKKQYYFKLTDDTITNLVNSNWRINSIYDYPIAVQITDNGTEKEPNKLTTVSNSIRIVEAKLHNLN